MARISSLLWLVALAALNLILLRYLEAIAGLSLGLALLVGLLPLLDLSVLCLYLALTRRFRFALARREARGDLVDSTAMASGAVLALATLPCLLAPEAVFRLVEPQLSPVERWIGASGSSPESRGFLLGATLAVLLSGPPIVLAVALGYLHSRFRIELTRRDAA